MGSADIVPGVSGGTIAFIVGIYQDLITSINTLTSTTLKLFLQLKWKEAWRSIPFGFLLPLGIGIIAAIALLTSLIAHLLATYPVFVWSFFFGLICASIFLIGKKLGSWTVQDVVVLCLSAGVAYWISGAVPSQTPDTPTAYFLAGMIAICAMILPGVSGSFLLILMGKYQQILVAVNTLDLMTLATFMAGAVLGLVSFAKVLGYLFEHHYRVVIAALTGFMLGSLRKVWPWKETLETYTDSHGEVIPLVQHNVLPTTLDAGVIGAVVLACVGMGLIVLLDRSSDSSTSGKSEF